jgi:hypothetical protein
LVALDVPAVTRFLQDPDVTSAKQALKRLRETLAIFEPSEPGQLSDALDDLALVAAKFEHLHEAFRSERERAVKAETRLIAALRERESA